MDLWTHSWNGTHPYTGYLLHNILLPCHNSFQSVFACTFFLLCRVSSKACLPRSSSSLLFEATCYYRIGRETKFLSSLPHGEGKENVSTYKSFFHIISIVLESQASYFVISLSKIFTDALEAYFGIILFLILSKKEDIQMNILVFCFFFPLSPGHSWFFTQSVIMFPLNVVFSTLNISYHSFMAGKVSVRIQLIALREFPYILLFVFLFCWLYNSAFNCNFCRLNYDMSQCECGWFILFDPLVFPLPGYLFSSMDLENY